MSLNSVMLSGLSALNAAQSGIRVASQNIANANTPGYVRTEMTLSPLTNLGGGSGVDVTGIKRAADRFLATASYIAEGNKGAAAARADILARAQQSFGDPTSDTSMFGDLDRFWSALSELNVDPSSTLRRDDAIGALQETYAQIHQVGTDVQSLIAEADQRIGESVSEVQDLIDRISKLNDEIQLTKRSGADASGAENAQSALIDQLSGIIDVRASPLAEGGVHVRTSGGALLVGEAPAKLSYTPNTAPFGSHGTISFNADQGAQANLEPYITGGELGGLLQVRDQDLPQLAEALGGFAGALGDALNEVHNDNASSPAVGSLSGRQTGLLSTDSLNFTGKSIVAITDSNGALKQRLTIDFDAGTITGEAPAATYNFANTIGAFTTALNTAMSAATPSGSASFSGGQMSLNVGNGGGIVVQQDATTPSARAGRGFSHFFGLNDIVSRPTPMFFENGLKSTDALGLNAGGQLDFQVKDSAGRVVGTRSIAITGALAAPSATWGDLVTALNANGTGLGGYGSAALDPNTGQLAISDASGFHISLMNDSTVRGATGVSVSSLNGLSQTATAARAVEVDVNSAIAADPGRLAVGRPDMTTAIGDQLIEAGDNRGANALADARDKPRQFPAAGFLLGQNTSLTLYAARLGGEAGRLASDAQRDSDGSEAVATAASDRRAQVEGVSLDDELMKMTVYQNAYAAAARVIQAATEMLDVLMTMGVTR
ncbi:MAG TPA: flagellar hook-associated protein FlgK [Caulobacterales bacterium]|nr:flagellar hook-associated protein FlgK [Caulobacterales bacterium]